LSAGNQPEDKQHEKMTHSKKIKSLELAISKLKEGYELAWQVDHQTARAIREQVKRLVELRDRLEIVKANKEKETADKKELIDKIVLIQPYACADKVQMRTMSRRGFQNFMRKRDGFQLYKPEPCTPDYNGGNWGAYDSKGGYHQVNTGNEYDSKAYLATCAKNEIWQLIAHKNFVHLID
tara:strand:+ start:59 stop:598 length:540 start_codon:yes stop_codon:yes gene_type:complete